MSPPPPLPLQPQLNIGGKEAFNAIFKYQGNNTAELEIFPVCLGISPLSYFSTAIILYQHVYLISARSMKKRFGHFGNKMTHFQMKFTYLQLIINIQKGLFKKIYEFYYRGKDFYQNTIISGC